MTDSHPNEVWKLIDDRYAVSNYGRVASVGFYAAVCGGGKRWVKPRILRPGKSSNGYLNVSLGREPHTVHRLVAKAFIANPLGLPCVNHKDGNRTNNCIDNLEWVTYEENEAHKYNVLGYVYKRKPWSAAERASRMATRAVPGNRPREQKIFCVETGACFPSMSECARRINVTQSTISEAVKFGYRVKGLHYAKQ